MVYMNHISLLSIESNQPQPQFQPQPQPQQEQKSERDAFTTTNQSVRIKKPLNPTSKPTIKSCYLI